MLVSDAAKKLGLSTQTLRLALQQGKFDFGVAIKTSDNRYTYYINPMRLHRYLEGRYDEKGAFLGYDPLSDSTDSGDHKRCG